MLGRHQGLHVHVSRARTCGPFEPNQREGPASLDQSTTVDSDNDILCGLCCAHLTHFISFFRFYREGGAGTFSLLR